MCIVIVNVFVIDIFLNIMYFNFSQEENARFLQLALYQGKVGKRKAVSIVSISRHGSGVKWVGLVNKLTVTSKMKCSLL